MVESFLTIFPRVHQPLRKSYLCSHCPRQTRVSVLNSHNDVWRPNEHWTASCFGRICEGRTRAPSQYSLEQAESDASSIDSVTKVNQYCSSDLHVLKSKTWDIDIFWDIEKISPDISNFVLGYLELFPGISGKIFGDFTWYLWLSLHDSIEERKWRQNASLNSTHVVLVLLIDAQVFLFPRKPLVAGLHPDNPLVSSWRFPDVDHEGAHSETEHVVKESHALGPQQGGADQPRLVSFTSPPRLYEHVWSEAWNEKRTWAN